MRLIGLILNGLAIRELAEKPLCLLPDSRHTLLTPSPDTRMQVSVIIPAYNAAEFIERAVESAIRLDEVGEIIIIDDGSTDGSVARIRSHVGNQKLTVQSNAGLSATLNRLLDQSTGDWIGWLNADDFYLEGAFAKVN